MAPAPAIAVFLGLVLACGGDDAAAPAPEAEPAPEGRPKGLAIDEDGGHPEGPLGREKSHFFGLVDAPRTVPLQDGRVLSVFTNPGHLCKVGDVAFEECEWLFDRATILRSHRLSTRKGSAATCAAARAELEAAYGPPRTESGAAVWQGERVRIRWRDDTAGRTRRCFIDYEDRLFWG